MNRLLILLALLIPAVSSAALPWEGPVLCRAEGIYRFRYAGRKVEELTGFCFNQGRSSFVSKNCEKETCAALGDAACRATPPPGAPGFEGPEICEALGGLPQDGAFFDGEKWWDMNRCYFAHDRSFVDLGVLAARRAQCFKK